MKKIYLQIIIFALIVVASFLSSARGERLSLNKLPVYPTGYELSSDMKQSKWDQEIYYKVNIDFPASDVISFYENEFRKNGFLPYSEDGYGTRRWENFDPSTGRWEKTSKLPARYIATWVDKEKTIRIVLFIRYKYDYQVKDWDKRLLINCSAGKFFKFEEKELSK